MAALTVSELYLACRNGDKATVERLLSRTPLRTLNCLEPNGSTCLHAASYHGHKEIVEMLLRHGASRRMINRYGCTPLDEAKTEEIAQLFPRSTEAAKQRFCNNPAQQLEWQFENDSAESYSRATHWDCVKDRGIKKTIKKLRKAQTIFDDGSGSSALVADFFQAALDTNDPIYLLRAYTAESPFYTELNREMARGNQKEVFRKLCKKWTGFYTGLIVKNPAFEAYRFSGETYRGMQITPIDLQQYKIGIALANKSFQSTSKSWKVAKGFACPSQPKRGTIPVILFFTIKDRRSALNIDQISEYQGEEEVLIVPGTLFIISDIDRQSQPYEIHLEQLQWANEF
ncbi:unnamed protein product [Adineta ricciae]|uniref:NAD(P)(+)--arginine ADP-ribosyltransferase n=1 Tax=Adineta ricciae TaxID=249248 RepID=A0A814Z1B1_ADIRI|nr:unnamed protein product [Adineta ricciae]